MIDFYSCVASFSYFPHTLRVKNFIWCDLFFFCNSNQDFFSSYFFSLSFFFFFFSPRKLYARNSYITYIFNREVFVHRSFNKYLIISKLIEIYFSFSIIFSYMKFLRPFSLPLSTHTILLSLLFYFAFFVAFRFVLIVILQTLLYPQNVTKHILPLSRECESIRVCNFTIHNFSQFPLVYTRKRKRKNETCLYSLFSITSFLFF